MNPRMAEMPNRALFASASFNGAHVTHCLWKDQCTGEGG
jgi:hypothetical protein